MLVMELEDVNIQTLINLGLNRSEARVYSALYEIGTATATTIAKASKVPRPDVYGALSKLNELGLVEKIIAHPLMFRSVPIETGVSVLLEQKSKKHNELKYKSASLIRRLNKKNIYNDYYYQGSQFVLIPSKEVLIKRLKKTIEETKTSIDIITSWKRFKFGCYRLAEPLEKAWSSGVEGRVIIEEIDKPALDFVKTYWKKPNAKIRHFKLPPKSVMAMYDEKEVFIFIDPTADMTECPALWSNNPNLVHMAKSYFETSWKKALESPKLVTRD